MSGKNIETLVWVVILLMKTMEFDLLEGDTRKEEGINTVSKNRQQILQLAKRIAVAFGKRKGYCTIDVVMNTLIEWGYSPAQLGNAAGAVFRDKHWKFSNTTKSKRVSNHARPITVWNYEETL